MKTQTQFASSVPPDWRRRLRSLHDGLTFAQGKQVAAQQASQLRDYLGLDTRPVSIEALARLPGLRVRRAALGSTARPLLSHSSYQRCGWLIQVDRSLTPATSRRAVAHEIKHVLDAGLLPDALARLTDRQRETLCDHFAAYLLLLPANGKLMQGRKQGRPCYSAARKSDMIMPSGPEGSKDDLASRETPHDNTP
jgi:hypothetical protein